ncbi:MAG: response regulator transcription factor [Vicinamibacterales bacterium]|jgi:DNA-binding NarL/FixJ family response regulator
MSDSTTVLLIDNHELVRAGVRRVLESCGRFRVVGDSPHGREVVALVATAQPEVIVLDPDTGDGVSLEVIGDLVEAASGSRILILTSLRDPHLCSRSVMLGAVGMVSKAEPPEVLFKAITKLSEGEAWLDRSKTAALLTAVVRRRRNEDPVDAKVQTLTRREREVIAGICEGLRNKELADRLAISEATVRNHVTSILDKLELSNRFDLVVFTFRHHLRAAMGSPPSPPPSPSMDGSPAFCQH